MATVELEFSLIAIDKIDLFQGGNNGRRFKTMD
nr:MAG TPA: hypothetical protein [Caudoviricetes sp.]